MTTCICVTPTEAQVLLDSNESTIQHIIIVNSDKCAIENLRISSACRVQIHEFSDILVRCFYRISYLFQEMLSFLSYIQVYAHFLSNNLI